MSVSDGLLSPRRESRQSAAETSLVSDFPYLGAGSWGVSEGEIFRQLFLPQRFFLSDFACRPSPPNIAISVCRFRSRRWVKLCDGEFHHQNKALLRKGRNQFCSRRSALSGAYDSPIRHPRAENRSQIACFKMGIPKGLAPGRRFGYFLDEEKVTRRRPTHGGNKIVLPCRKATRNSLS